MKFSSKLIYALAGVVLLCGCAKQIYKPYTQSKKAADQTEKDIGWLKKTNESTSLKAKPAVVTLTGYYVNLDPVSLSKQPKWLNKKVNVRAGKLKLSQLLARLLRNTPATITYQGGVSKNAPLSLYYSGTIRGALDKISAQTNYIYTIKGNRIVWKAFITKTFDISFMPGTANYLVGQTADQDSGDRGSSSGTGTVIKANLNTSQYSNLRGEVSVWKDLESTLDKLKSTAGQVVISEATTSVTVTDHPANVRAMERYIKRLNVTLSKQVSLHVQVLEIELNKAFNFGVDWNLVSRHAGREVVRFASSFAGATGTASNFGQLATGQSLLSFGNNNKALFNALNTQGKLRVVTQPTLVTTNNQVAEIRITQDKAYLEKVSTTVQSGANGATTSSLTPGVVTDGFALYMLPKIQKRKVYMQISSDLSTLTSLEKVDNRPTETQGGNQATGEFQSIQVPTISSKHFNQRAVIPSGATLIIAGFKQLRDELKKAGLPGGKIADALASKGSDSKNVQTIVLITPYILEN